MPLNIYTATLTELYDAYALEAWQSEPDDNILREIENEIECFADRQNEQREREAWQSMRDNPSRTLGYSHYGGNEERLSGWCP